MAHPWLQAALLGMTSPMHLKQRITGQPGRDFVGPVVQQTENIRSLSRESGMPRSSVLVSRQGHDAQYRVMIGWDHASREANISITTLRRMMDSENIRLLSAESDLHEMETLNGTRLLQGPGLLQAGALLRKHSRQPEAGMHARG